MLVAAAEEADEAHSLSVKLLADIRQVFIDACTSFLPSQQLVAALCQIEESPWGDFGLTVRKLAFRLKGFEVTPDRGERNTVRGYHLSDFSEAFARYLRPEPSKRPQTGDEQGKPVDALKSVDGSIRLNDSKCPQETAAQTLFEDGWTVQDGCTAGPERTDCRGCAELPEAPESVAGGPCYECRFSANSTSLGRRSGDQEGTPA
jgi:hypothetical protein